MSLDDALNISVSGINANRVHMEIISSNLANINTTRTVQGGPYRRKIPIFSEKQLEFRDELKRAEARRGGDVDMLSSIEETKHVGGIELTDVVEDSTPFQKVYKPGHPDADENGFVSLPNVSMSKEMIDMVYVSKLYEANITVYNASKKMMQETLSIQ